MTGKIKNQIVDHIELVLYTVEEPFRFLIMLRKECQQCVGDRMEREASARRTTQYQPLQWLKQEVREGMHQNGGGQSGWEGKGPDIVLHGVINRMWKMGQNWQISACKSGLLNIEQFKSLFKNRIKYLEISYCCT